MAKKNQYGVTRKEIVNPTRNQIIIQDHADCISVEAWDGRLSVTPTNRGVTLTSKKAIKAFAKMVKKEAKKALDQQKGRCI